MVVDVASIFCMSANQELVNGGGSRGFRSRDETIYRLLLFLVPSPSAANMTRQVREALHLQRTPALSRTCGKGQPLPHRKV